MHTVKEIKEEFLRLDKLLGINTSNIEIVFSKRTVKRHGSCKCVRMSDGAWRPEKVMIADFLRTGDDFAFWDTVRHEYAHAAATLITGKNCGHNAIWKSICKKIGCSGNVRAESTTASRQRARDAAKYAVTCLGCGEVSLYMRKTELIKRLEKGGPSGVICTVCGGKKFKLTHRA
ncbi:MAG: SprT-like domain-containing protein [Oscillospiraceae bacterium]|nr:SprT-like domain-containing protein [Oscillospiraceae bacterium]